MTGFVLQGQIYLFSVFLCEMTQACFLGFYQNLDVNLTYRNI